MLWHDALAGWERERAYRHAIAGELLKKRIAGAP
jgi:hypothetical protein